MARPIEGQVTHSIFHLFIQFCFQEDDLTTCYCFLILQVWDVGNHIRSMETSGPDAPGQPSTVRQAPLYIFTGHKDEGYALDWSPVTAGRLLSGR